MTAIGKKFHTLSAFAVLVSCLFGCGSRNPEGPSSSVPPPMVLYKNGAYGTWFGEALTASMSSNASGSFSNAMDVTDTVTGDTTALLVDVGVSNASCAATPAYFQISGQVGENASAYSKGHLQFDVMLGPSYTGSGFTIGINVPSGDVCGSNNNDVTIASSNLSSSTFTHVSIPLSSLNAAFTYVGTPLNLMATTDIYLDNIQWTGN
jgi:hypothetical protein